MLCSKTHIVHVIQINFCPSSAIPKLQYQQCYDKPIYSHSQTKNDVRQCSNARTNVLPSYLDVRHLVTQLVLDQVKWSLFTMRLKTKENFELSDQSQSAVAYERWSLTNVPAIVIRLGKLSQSLTRGGRLENHPTIDVINYVSIKITAYLL